MSKKVIELVHKLKELALRGVGGEKENAKRKLEALLLKYNLSLEDIEQVKREEYIFKCKRIQQRIMMQCIMMIMGKDIKMYCVRGKKYDIGVHATSAEFIEIMATFDFYWNLYEEQLELFQSAFIQKNKLLPHDAEVVSLGNEDAATRARWYKIAMMQEGIEKRTMQKRIGQSANH